MNSEPTLNALKGLVEERTGNRFKHARWESAILPILSKICSKKGSRYSLSDLFLALKNESIKGTLWSQVIVAVTVHKTNFFRESHHFDFLKKKFLEHCKNAPAGKIFRVWSAACSTGEEAYSIAFTLTDLNPNVQFEILGTDLDKNVIQVAKNGVYPDAKADEVSGALRKSYFKSGSGAIAGWNRIEGKYRKNVKFMTANLLNLSQFKSAEFDFIFCRNVFIYFDPKTILTIVSQFLRLLKPEGYLVIGTTESLGDLDQTWHYVEPSICQKKSESAEKTVLVVDDSPTMQRLLQRVLGEIPGVRIVGFASSVSEGKRLVESLNPDLVTLDIELPDGTGLDLLRWIMTNKPKPCIMVSSLDPISAPYAIASLEEGAIDYVRKRSLDQMPRFTELMSEAIEASMLSVVWQKKRAMTVSKGPRKPTQKSSGLSREKTKIIALGASTGGIQTLEKILTELPADLPCVLVVQHIPALFSRAFAIQLSSKCKFPVKEAQNEDPIVPGVCYIAPGGLQMSVEKKAGKLVLKIEDGDRVSGHKPSVDKLFMSLAKHCPDATLGILLTGMGSDGARGLSELKKAGALTIAQDEQSSIVFGMPRAAIEMGAASKVVSLVDMADEIVGF